MPLFTDEPYPRRRPLSLQCSPQAGAGSQSADERLVKDRDGCIVCNAEGEAERRYLQVLLHGVCRAARWTT